MPPINCWMLWLMENRGPSARRSTPRCAAPVLILNAPKFHSTKARMTAAAMDTYLLVNTRMERMRSRFCTWGAMSRAGLSSAWGMASSQLV